MDSITHKLCPACEQIKPSTDFHRTKSTKTGLACYCKPCTSARAAAYWKENGKRLAPHRKAYKQANKASTAADARKYRARHGDRWRAMHRAEMVRQRTKNPQKNRDQVKRWREQNPGKNKAMLHSWYERNKEKAIAAGHKRRTQITLNGGEYTPQQWRDLKTYYDHRCLRCGRQEPEIELTVDHVVPVSHGGSSDISNLQPLCEHCNKSKKDRTIDYRSSMPLAQLSFVLDP